MTSVFFFFEKPKIAFWMLSHCFKHLSLTFSHTYPPQCVTVIWHDLASSRRRASTSVRQTISACTEHAVTAVTPSSQERWSLLWDARTTPSALSAVCAGMQAAWQIKHTCNRLSVHTVLSILSIWNKTCTSFTQLCFCNQPILFSLHSQLCLFFIVFFTVYSLKH